MVHIRIVSAAEVMLSDAAWPGPKMICGVQAPVLSAMVTASLAPGAAVAVPPAVVSVQSPAVLQLPPATLFQL